MIPLIEPKHLLGHFVYFFVLLYVDLTTLAFKQIWLGRDQAVAVLTVGVKITVWLILHCGLFYMEPHSLIVCAPSSNGRANESRYRHLQ